MAAKDLEKQSSDLCLWSYRGILSPPLIHERMREDKERRRFFFFLSPDCSFLAFSDKESITIEIFRRLKVNL